MKRETDSPKCRLGKILCLAVALSMIAAMMPGFCAAADEALAENTYYKIIPLFDETKVLATYNEDTSGDAGIMSYTYESRNNKDTAHWIIRYENNAYSLENVAVGKYMEVQSASRDAGKLVALYESNGNNCQRWLISPVKHNGKTAYRIVNKNSGLFVNTYADETIVTTQQKYSDDEYQLFYIEKAVQGQTDADFSYVTQIPDDEACAKSAVEGLGLGDVKDLKKFFDTSVNALVEGRVDTYECTGDVAVHSIMGSAWSWNNGQNLNGNTNTKNNGGSMYSGVNVKLYSMADASKNVNVLQFWASEANGVNPLYAQTSENSGEKMSFYVYEFYPSEGSGEGGIKSGSIKFLDSDSKTLIAEFGYADGELSVGDVTKTVGNRDKKVKILVTNNDNATHTVKWIVDGEEIATQALEGNVSELGKIEVLRSEIGGSWAHLGLAEFKGYGGYFNQGEISETIDGGDVELHEGLPEKITVNGEEKIVSWVGGTLLDEVGEKTVQGFLVTTGQTVNVKFNVVSGDVEKYLTHYYTFDTDLNDKKGNAHGEAADSEKVIIQNGYVNLADSYITLPSGLMTGYEQFTVSAYYSTTAFQKWSRIFDFGNGSGGGDLFYAASNGTSGRAGVSAGSASQYSPHADSLGRWYHIVITGDKNGKVTLYRDNNTKWMNLSGADYSTIFTDSAKYHIGKSNWSGDWWYNGCIDEFKIYNVAMVPSEVEAFMNEDAPYEKYVVNAQTSLVAKSDTNQVGLGINIDENSNASGYGVKVNYTLADSTTGEKDALFTEGNFGAIFTDATNARFLFTPYIVLADGSKIYGEAFKTSVYETVIEDIASGTYTSSSVDEQKIAKVNEIIAKGGVIALNDLGSVRGKLMDVSVQENIITISVKEKFAALGIGFIYNGSLYVGSESESFLDSSAADEMVYTTVTIDTDAKTATLSDAQGSVQEAEVIFLDAVELEFVQEIIDEIVADEATKVESGSFEDIM